MHACTTTQKYLHAGKQTLTADAVIWNGDDGGIPVSELSN